MAEIVFLLQRMGRGALLFPALLLFFSSMLSLHATPRNYYDQETATALREMRDTLGMLQHELANHEIEMRMLAERISNQEATISSLRQQLLDANQANKELVVNNIASYEDKISQLDAANKNLVADMRQLKTHANETSTVLAEFKKTSGRQTKNIDNLQTALRSLTEALQAADGAPGMPKDQIADSDSKIYAVKPGDNLEKIARDRNTTIKAIKELNNLANDRIKVGQKLRIP